MKDVMIEQLKKELEKNIIQIVEFKEKEAGNASKINSLEQTVAQLTEKLSKK